MLRPPSERPFQDLVLQIEMDIMRVHRMRYNRCRKGEKIFELLVDELSTWITKDQLENLTQSYVAC